MEPVYKLKDSVEIEILKKYGFKKHKRDSNDTFASLWKRVYDIDDREYHGEVYYTVESVLWFDNDRILHDPWASFDIVNNKSVIDRMLKDNILEEKETQ